MFGRAGGAPAPEDDLGLIDLEAVVGVTVQAGSFADGAVDVGDRPAGSAHHVMVVVADAGLVACDRPGGLDASHQAGIGEGTQDVVHGLVGHDGEITSGGTNDGVSVRVRFGVHCIEHRHTGPGHAQTRRTQRLLEVGFGGHVSTLPSFPESVKKCTLALLGLGRHEVEDAAEPAVGIAPAGFELDGCGRLHLC